MTTGSVTVGSGVSGLIVNGPVPVMLKLMTSGTFAVAFADRIACRSEPAPLSLVLVTTKVAPHAGSVPAAANRTAIVPTRRMKSVDRCVFIVIAFRRYPGIAASLLRGTFPVNFSVSRLSSDPCRFVGMVTFSGETNEKS